MTKLIPAIAVLAALMPAAAFAQGSTTTPAANACGQLEIVNRIQMFRLGGRDFVSVTINGVKRNLLFDTRGYFSQVSYPLAREFNMRLENGASEVIDLTGRRSGFVATVDSFTAGQMHGANLLFQVATDDGLDGIFALDRWQGVDLDIDFGTDTLNMFSQTIVPEPSNTGPRQRSP